jgi:hypothetical protein
MYSPFTAIGKSCEGAELPTQWRKKIVLIEIMEIVVKPY